MMGTAVAVADRPRFLEEHADVSQEMSRTEHF
jgi:hypothetical protein